MDTAEDKLNDFEPYEMKKGEEYMGEAMQKHFRSMLTQMKEQIMEKVDVTVNSMRDKERFADPNDRASLEEEIGLNLRARNREAKLLHKIEQTIDSLESGDYGYCEGCGIEIGLRRLEARPTATLCIDCKTLDEIREKQRSG